ncbi:MAG TPA: hypothetical protein PKA82_15550 [Pyrinomonadaceae bacterium]|nr:hypothetical protein [Pyrinomonadaceae bacterium]
MSNRRPLLTAAFLSVMLAASCGSSPPTANTSLPPIDQVAPLYPFSVVEPQVYSCKITETTGSVSRVYFAARNGDRTRLDIDHGLPNQTTVIHDGRTIRIDHKSRTYVESPAPAAQVPQLGTTDSMFRSMLYEFKRAKFEKIETTDGITKYLTSTDSETASERFIYVDERTGFLKRIEMFSIEGETRREVMRIEVSEFTNEAADDLFKIPGGFGRKAQN